MNDALALGVDIGGSHITTALIDHNSRSLLPGSWQRERVNANGSAVAIIRSWSHVMKKSMETATGVYRIGIAMPGPFDYEGGVSFIKGLHKYDALYGLNVKELLAEQLHIDARYIKMANDAQCFLQGELFAGAVKGHDSVTGLTLGTGFGASVAANGVAQETHFFEMPFLESRAEDYFSTRWFIKRYRELCGKEAADVKAIAAAIKECAAAVAVFYDFGTNLALFLSTLQPVPAVVLLGGNIAHTYPLFKAALETKLRECGIQISFELSALGEHAALLGAAGIAFE